MSVAPSYSQKALSEELGELSSAQKGQRNIVLFKTARKLFSLCAAGILEEKSTVLRLRETALSIGLSVHEINSTMANARVAGFSKPRNFSRFENRERPRKKEFIEKIEKSEKIEKTEKYDLDIFRPWAKRIAERAERYAQEREGHDFYAKRGIDDETVRELHLGWIPAGSFFFPAEQTGRRDGGKTCTPHGACLPVFNAAGDIDCLLIRRAERSQWDKYGKWCQLGKEKLPFLLGEKGRPLAICESILDAASVWQVKRGFWSVAALLGASKSPDDRLLEFIRKARAVLICADSDDGGEALCAMVLAVRPDAEIWRPVGSEIKDVNDFLVQLGEDQLCLWLDIGLAQTIKDGEEF